MVRCLYLYLPTKLAKMYLLNHLMETHLISASFFPFFDKLPKDSLNIEMKPGKSLNIVKILD